ncbi:MAG: IclR family transcriptional regulator [Thermaerobacter sp.]|nr:IclR family transcriptional regulator [Thermaerobacter sp.]
MATYKAPPIERAFAVLELVGAASSGLTLADLVEATELPKTTVFVVVSSLRDLGALRLEDTRYFLGPKIAELGGQAVQRMDIRSVALPHMQRLAEQTGLTVHLGVLGGSTVHFVAKVETEGFIRFNTYVGLTQPFHLSSLGKAIAAYLPEEQLEAALRTPLVRRTRYTTTEPATFRDHLLAVRRLGYAVEDEENEEGVRCIGAPIFDGSGNVAAVSVTAIRSQLPVEAFADTSTLVMSAANAISGDLGGAVRPPIPASRRKQRGKAGAAQ